MFPAAGYLEIALAALARKLEPNRHSDDQFLILDEISFPQALFIGDKSRPRIQTNIDDQGCITIDAQEINDDAQWSRNFRAHGYVGKSARRAIGIDLIEGEETIGSGDLYKSFAAMQLDYGDHFKCLSMLRRAGEESIAELSQSITEENEFEIAPAVLDGGFQAAIAALSLADERRPFLPNRRSASQVLMRPRNPRYCYAKLLSREVDTCTFDLAVTSADGDCLVEISGWNVVRRVGQFLAIRIEKPTYMSSIGFRVPTRSQLPLKFCQSQARFRPQLLTR